MSESDWFTQVVEAVITFYCKQNLPKGEYPTDYCAHSQTACVWANQNKDQNDEWLRNLVRESVANKDVVKYKYFRVDKLENLATKIFPNDPAAVPHFMNAVVETLLGQYNDNRVQIRSLFLTERGVMRNDHFKMLKARGRMGLGFQIFFEEMMQKDVQDLIDVDNLLPPNDVQCINYDSEATYRAGVHRLNRCPEATYPTDWSELTLTPLAQEPPEDKFYRLPEYQQRVRAAGESAARESAAQ